MTKKSGDYEVGYGKTPVRTRYKPGQSGNKKGRPKGSKNLKTDLQDELGGKISVLIDGKKVKVTKQKAWIKHIVALALKGNHKAMTLLFHMYMKMLADETEVDANLEEALSDTDKAILEQFAAKILSSQKSED